ncbi:hypothetical protein GIY30_16670 [Gordonia sp. HNM0687]|uniref:Uncharacterized protein n=1 Tax=Gordonia mangrovi TaxID=2665643 RepID=A0A6L7GTZ9_9ACTN|nr:hypothetical protein [Gordonia mangrovi]MXP22972.1 hypothetical protein [Gordonia mangrovi]UVF77268.1 hypothetical protein NWF22_18485 [Gordonia mangrovi]
MRKNTRSPHVALVVVDDDPAVRDHARTLFAHDIPFGVVSGHYSAVVPFMLGNNGHTVALVADVDDPDQLAEAIVATERRLGPVGAVIRYASDLPGGTAAIDGAGSIDGAGRGGAAPAA